MPFDDLRMRELLRELEHWENRVAHLYLDTRGNPTIGLGCLIPDVTAFAALPMRTGVGELAADQQKRAEFARVAAMTAGLAASAYAGKPRVFLSDGGIDGLALRRLDGMVAALRRLCPGFDGFPEPAQTCLVDLAWNLGAGKLRSDFPRLIRACNSGDWRTAAIESHVSSSRAARNEWRANLFVQAVARG